MKLRHIAFALLTVFCAVFAVVSSLPTASLVWFVGGAALTPWSAMSGQLCVTLTPTLILQQTIKAFAVACPFIRNFSSDFTTERVKLNQSVIAHIRTRPTVNQFAGNYETSAQEGRDLLTDVPMIMDKHSYTTVKLSDLYALGDSKITLQEHFNDSGAALAKGVADYILGKVDSKAFSYDTILTEANSDRDMLSTNRQALNIRGVQNQRFGIVNSPVASALSNDARIANRYSGTENQFIGDDAFLRFKKLEGFQTIDEYSDLPTGNGTALTGITGVAATNVITKVAHGLLVNDRVTIPAITGGTGITAGATPLFVKTVPSADTLTLSATRGGAELDFSTAITDGTITKTENITGFFGSREAIAIKTALPTDGLEAAEAFGIPTSHVKPMIVTDPDSGLSMIAYLWFKSGSMDAYMTIAVMYGASAGAQGGTAGTLLDKAGQILRSA